MKFKYLILILIIIVIYLFYKKRRKEYFFSYDPVSPNRDDLCDIYIDTFFNAYINASNKIKKPFLDWCHSWKIKTDDFPEYRPAEKLFLGLNRYYTNFPNKTF